MNPRRVGSVMAVVVAFAAVAACSKPDPDEHAKRGDDYVTQGKLEEAVIDYRSALNAAPNRGDIRLKLGDVYVQQSKLGHAAAGTSGLPICARTMSRSGQSRFVPAHRSQVRRRRGAREEGGRRRPQERRRPDPAR